MATKPARREYKEESPRRTRHDHEKECPGCGHKFLRLRGGNVCGACRQNLPANQLALVDARVTKAKPEPVVKSVELGDYVRGDDQSSVWPKRPVKVVAICTDDDDPVVEYLWPDGSDFYCTVADFLKRFRRLA